MGNVIQSMLKRISVWVGFDGAFALLCYNSCVSKIFGVVVVVI